MRDEYRNYLQTAVSMPHSNRSLWDHLLGTWTILKEAGEPEYLCDAGLFHSVYGTRHYRLQCVPFERRHEVQELIGLQAEHLVYLFCVIDRPKVLFDKMEIVINHHTGGFVDISLWASDLMKIERANLEEQHESH
jgi:hypothetical protein